jgi:fucose permease
MMALTVFFCIGGSVAVTAYLDEFLEVTKIIQSRHKAHVLLALWICITIGRILGVMVQRTLKHSKLLVTYIFFLLCFGSASLVLILTCPRSSAALLLGISGYGCSHGPIIGFVYDLNNRLTFPTEKSTAIIMLGLNLGTSLFPFFCSFLWKQFGPTTLFTLVLLSTSLPLPLLYIAYYNRYQKSHSFKTQYHTISVEVTEHRQQVTST